MTRRPSRVDSWFGATPASGPALCSPSAGAPIASPASMIGPTPADGCRRSARTPAPGRRRRAAPRRRLKSPRCGERPAAGHRRTRPGLPPPPKRRNRPLWPRTWAMALSALEPPRSLPRGQSWMRPLVPACGGSGRPSHRHGRAGTAIAPGRRCRGRSAPCPASTRTTLRCRIFGQARRQDAARRPGPDDEDVERLSNAGSGGPEARAEAAQDLLLHGAEMRRAWPARPHPGCGARWPPRSPHAPLSRSAMRFGQRRLSSAPRRASSAHRSRHGAAAHRIRRRGCCASPPRPRDGRRYRRPPARPRPGVTAARWMRAISNGEARSAASRASAGSITLRNSMISIGLVPLARSPPNRCRGPTAGRRAPARVRRWPAGVSRARRKRCRFTCSCSAMARSDGIEPVSATMPRTASISGLISFAIDRNRYHAHAVPPRRLKRRPCRDRKPQHRPLANFEPALMRKISSSQPRLTRLVGPWSSARRQDYRRGCDGHQGL